MSMRTLCAASLVMICVATADVRAQTATRGAISGRVLQQDGTALGGVTVTANSEQTPTPISAITNKSGSFKIDDLIPGTYTVVFWYAGQRAITYTGVHVTANASRPLHPRVDIDKLGDVIHVTGKLFVDPTKTDLVFVADEDYLRRIPVPGRDQEAALGGTPGSAGDGVGVSFSGSSGNESSYNIDGVPTTGLSYGTMGTRLLNDFIHQIEVISGGYNAEYGRSTGAVVNVVTKTGSNELRGAVFSYLTPGFLVANRQRTPTEASSIDVESNVAYEFDFGFDLGGPVVKDKVWFYVGFAPRLQRTNIDRITKRQTDCRELMANGQLSSCDPSLGDGVADEDPNTGFRIYEEIDRARLRSESTGYQFVAKLNFAVAPEHQGQISFIGSPLTGQSVGVRGDPSATSYDFTQLTTDVAAKWTSKMNNNKTQLEAVFGWHRSTVEANSINDAANALPRENLYFGNLGTWSNLGFESASTAAGCADSAAAGDPYPFITNCPDEGAGYSLGGPGSIVDEKEERLSLRLSGVHRVDFLGNHELKAGIDLEQNRLNDLRNISGGVWYDNLLAPYNQVHTLRWVRLAPPGNPMGLPDTCSDRGDTETTNFDCEHLMADEVVGRTLNWSAYLRDSWQLRPNLTLNFGLRYEEQRLRYAHDLQNTTDPFTGNTLGKNAMTLQNMWAPRLGALWDWTRQGKSKLFGHWGRFYESIPMDINNRSFGGETMYQQMYDSSTQCGAYHDGRGGVDPSQCSGVPALGETLFGSGVLIAPGVKAQFMDELVVGVEYEVVDDLKVGITLQNRAIGRVLEDVSVDNAATYILANPGEWSTSEELKLRERIDALPDGDEKDRLNAQLAAFQKIRSFDKPRRDYNALQITATRRFSRNFFMQGSYTYSRTRGNYPGLFSADNGQLDPNISSQFDLIELLSNRDGPLPVDRPHYVKLDSYYIFDFERQGEMTTGVRFRALSGTPVNALGRHYLYGNNEAFLLPRGAMGRTDFDFGIDLHLAYSRTLRKGIRLEVFTDLFGLLNRQGVASASSTYTIDPVNPIVGGDYEDLIFAKRQTSSGGESSDPVRRWRNFTNPIARYAPFRARLGARLTF